jgi:hypothetical protein
MMAVGMHSFWTVVENGGAKRKERRGIMVRDSASRAKHPQQPEVRSSSAPLVGLLQKTTLNASRAEKLSGLKLVPSLSPSCTASLSLPS